MTRRFDELQRQIEMAALIFEQPDKYSESDLAKYFFTSEATIRRDVKILRDMGIIVHSRKRAYDIKLTLKELNFLITTYLAFGNNETIKNLKLIHEKFKNKTLNFFVQTMKAVREKKVIEIEYKSVKTDRYQWRTVTPVSFYNAGKTHYLIAIHDQIPKIFTIERIHSARYPNQKSPIKEVPSLNELFKYSWGSFTGGAVTKVRLRFRENLEKYMAEKFWIETQEIIHTDDGFEIAIEVKLSNEFIAWVMGWGDQVTILEPKELKDAVLKKAKAIADLYK
jgi:predicted DNA-binding transcriptional regulator YafY